MTGRGCLWCHSSFIWSIHSLSSTYLGLTRGGSRPRRVSETSPFLTLLFSSSWWIPRRSQGQIGYVTPPPSSGNSPGSPLCCVCPINLKQMDWTTSAVRFSSKPPPNVWTSHSFSNGGNPVWALVFAILALTLILTASQSAANHPIVHWRSRPNEAKRTTSAAKAWRPAWGSIGWWGGEKTVCQRASFFIVCSDSSCCYFHGKKNIRVIEEKVTQKAHKRRPDERPLVCLYWRLYRPTQLGGDPGVKPGSLRIPQEELESGAGDVSVDKQMVMMMMIFWQSIQFNMFTFSPNSWLMDLVSGSFCPLLFVRSGIMLYTRRVFSQADYTRTVNSHRWPSTPFNNNLNWLYKCKNGTR